MKSDLQNFHGQFFPDYSQRSTNENWLMVKDFLLNTMERHIPSKTTKSQASKPWITPQLKRMIRRKTRLYKKAKRTNSTSDWDQFKSFRKEVQKKIRTSYWSYTNQMLNDPDDKHKKNFWRFIKAKRQDDAGISPLTHNGTTVSDSKGKATILNTQFKSVFTTEQLTDLPSMAESPYPEVQHIRISEEGVLKQLKQINITKATGPDLIPARILKEMADEIAPLLTCIFQQSLDTGEVPHDWRIANIAPIYKKGDRSVAANYRPVSLTSISCKILEHIIFSQVMDHYDSHNILIDSQHGFRSGRSCESQLIITAHDFAKTLDDRMQLDSIILDFSKAFDCVPHHRLLLKLHNYGIRGSLLT